MLRMTNAFSFDPKTTAGETPAVLRPASSPPMPGDGDPVFLTEKELAARWRLSTRTLQRWRRDGRGPDHAVIGERILYPVTRVLDNEHERLRQGDGS
jgi:hypothetical protein